MHISESQENGSRTRVRRKPIGDVHIPDLISRTRTGPLEATAHSTSHGGDLRNNTEILRIPSSLTVTMTPKGGTARQALETAIIPGKAGTASLISSRRTGGLVS